MTTPAEVPEGYGTVTPWIATRDTARLIDFCKTAFDAEELARVVAPDGAIGHAEVRIGNSIVMMFDSPFVVDTPALLRLYVRDADATYQKALRAGASPVTQMTELFWGDRVGRVRDPLGNIWWLQERAAADMTPAEIAARANDPSYLNAMSYVQISLAQALGTSTIGRRTLA